MRLPGDAVGIQVPVGRIGASRSHWQTIFEGRDKPSLYRLHNGIPADAEDAGNALIVEVDGAKRTIQVSPGTSVDVSGKKIRVKAATASSWKAGTSSFPSPTCRGDGVAKGRFP
jgi:hypothetical protein